MLSHKVWTKQRDLLLDLIGTKSPDLRHLLGKIGSEPLSDEEVEAVSDFLMNEFIKHGLRQDSEPNEYGKSLDDLMGFVPTLAENRWHFTQNKTSLNLSFRKEGNLNSASRHE